MGYVTKKLGIRSQKARRDYIERKLGVMPGRRSKTLGFWLLVGLACLVVITGVLIAVGLFVQ